MTTAQHQEVKRLGTEHHTAGIYLTPNGIDLLVNDPLTLQTFLDSGQQLTAKQAPAKGAFEFIGNGRIGHVYGLPESDDLCLKLVSPRTRKDRRWNPNTMAGLPSLVVEAKFMHMLGKRLGKKPESGVKSPVQYGVARFAGGSVLLQQKVPKEYATLRKLIFENRGVDGAPTKEKFLEQGEIAFSRAKQAIGPSVLNLALTDLRGEQDVVNLGNFLIDREKLAEDGDVYLVDMVGHRRSSRIAARSLAVLA